MLQIGKNPSGGRRKAEEQAIFTGVQVYYKHVKVVCDNISAIFYVKNKEGIKSEICKEIAKEPWV